MPEPQQANVRSVEALETFRSHLIVYLSQARAALEEVSADLSRTRQWLDDDQRRYWDNQMRRRLKELEQAQQALFSARLSILDQQSSAEQLAVHRAKRAVEEGEDKLRVLKRWGREYDGRVQPLVKQMEKLHSVLTNDMVKAVAYLTQAINTLAGYAEIHAPSEAAPTPPAGGVATPKPKG
ncbi:MAG TPA: hypothetical protein VN578_19045 [Candidatus Binatia bacterium]|jgi:hypothetical protein|nr:hypothetical protein [Candidatus Binatia bacterium]